MTKLFARVGFQYDDDTTYDRGEVVKLLGYKNDASIRRTLLGESESDETYACGTCGREFVAPGLRTEHGRKVHPVRSTGKSARAEVEAEEKDEELLAPTV